ncbi:MAG TPA: TonB-dependent receptor, partial [Nitrospira sp.]|nr:TonB-dependent receptor [Nitrospira sp.]
AVVVNGTTLIPAQPGRPTFNISRDVKSAFGELVVPLFGRDNATTMFRELSLSLSARYDDYSDVGDTFNPKIGVTYKPVDGIRLRGSWGESFNAPSLADSSQAALTTGTYLGPIAFLPGFLGFVRPPANLVANGTYPAPGNFQTILLIGGNSPGIKPQEAETLSLGADFEPSFVPGLRFGATYWKIWLDGRIGLAPFFDRNLWWNSFGSKITINPTGQQITDALAITDSVTGTQCFGLPSNCVYAIFDTRKTNLGNVRVSGLDFYLNYLRETGFGSIDFAVSGSYELTRKESPAPDVAYVDQLAANFNRFRTSTTLGADISNLRAQVTWNFRQGYDLSPAAGIVGQTRVDDFHVFNLFFRYDVKGEGALSDLAFTLNVDNVFDQDPPVDWSVKATASQAGFGNGSTLGRLIQFGVSKKF